MKLEPVADFQTSGLVVAIVMDAAHAPGTARVEVPIPHRYRLAATALRLSRETGQEPTMATLRQHPPRYLLAPQ